MSNAGHQNGEGVTEKWDRVFRAVAADPRRQIVGSLLDTDEGASVSLPAAALNPNVSRDVETLRRELYHTHLPMLEEMAFVHWDTDPFVASRGPDFEEVAIVFDALQAKASDIPESLVAGCRRLEAERESQ